MPEHPLLTVQEIRQAETSAQAGLPQSTLMQRAGTAAADLAALIGSDRPGSIWILAGPGNNGGDALVAARVLAGRGYAVQVALLDDPGRFKGDAAAAWQAWEGVSLRDLDGPGDRIGQASLIVDGLFGIGLNRPLSAGHGGRAHAWIEAVNRLAAEGIPVLALDVPSGLQADTGQAPGSAIRASHTLTFIADKPGLHTGAGVDLAGRVHVAALGLAPLPSPGGLISPACFAAALRKRPGDSHKGMFGRLGIVGGNSGMVGAALLAARAGLHAGAGRVYVQLLGDDAPRFDAVQPELMLRPAHDTLELESAVVGPGMGTDARARRALAAGLRGAASLVLDADALLLLGSRPALATALRERQHSGNSGATDATDATDAAAARLHRCILTPHPREAAALLGCGTDAIQSDRIAAALAIARRYRAIVILKGAGSVVARPEGEWRINPTGNPGLATAGTGDVLSGLAGALLAQGWPAWEASLAAAWIHGAAADRLLSLGVGPVGLVAGELIPAIRAILNALIGLHVPGAAAATRPALSAGAAQTLRDSGQSGAFSRTMPRSGSHEHWLNDRNDREERLRRMTAKNDCEE